MSVVGRGVLLDVARQIGVDSLEDGVAITNNDLDATAKAQGVEIRRGDFVIVRTGQMEQRLRDGEWGGYAGGDAPGLALVLLIKVVASTPNAEVIIATSATTSLAVIVKKLSIPIDETTDLVT